jgi:hypothetical protein
MLERDLQRESCSCSKIVLVNWSNKVRSSLLKEPKTVNPMGMKVAQLGLMTGRYFAFSKFKIHQEIMHQIIRKILLQYGLNTGKIRLPWIEWIRFICKSKKKKR